MAIGEPKGASERYRGAAQRKLIPPLPEQERRSHSAMAVASIKLDVRK